MRNNIKQVIWILFCLVIVALAIYGFALYTLQS